MLAARLLWRHWRSGELTILSLALCLAVVIVTIINVFTTRLEATLVQESHTFLAADRVVRSAAPIPAEWQAYAAQVGLRQAQTATFPSMIFAGDAMNLATVKAVTDAYPLVGYLQVSDQPFAASNQSIQRQGGPDQGSVWIESRLFPLLDVAVGDEVQVGRESFTVSKVIVSEPDRGDGFSLFGARLMMNYADLPATEVIQPGSRVSYRWLLAGPAELLEEALEWVRPQFQPGQKEVTLELAQRGLSSSLERGKTFLLVAAAMAVLLAGVAIAIAAQRFYRRHIEQVALLKSLGVRRGRIRRLYVMQLLLLAILAALIGTVIGDALQRGLALWLATQYDVVLQPSEWFAYAYGWVTALISVLCFALPPLWPLAAVPPIRIFRRDLTVAAVSTWAQYGFAIMAFALLTLLFSRDLLLTAAILVGVLTIAAIASVLAWGLLHLGAASGSRAGHYWRLAVANLTRQRQQTVIQVVAFATTFMFLFALVMVRTSLIDEWQVQLPDDAPNHFLLNIAQHEVADVEQLLQADRLEFAQLYPMVRGRITQLNGSAPSAALQEEHNVFQREVNLSWVQELGPDNRIVAGQWWPQLLGERNLPGVSVEQDLAERIGLTLGDEVTFRLGGFDLTAQITSLRTLQWDSMQPNFYFLFEPGALEEFAPSYMTSVYVPPAQKSMVNTLLRQHPTVVVLEMDRVIEQIRTVVERVTQAVELVMWMMLLCGVMVLLAAVHASLDVRLQEAGLLRALGASKRLLLRSLWVEYGLLGMTAGILAVAGAEALLWGLQSQVLNMQVSIHYPLWGWGLLVSTAVIAVSGVAGCRKVVNTPPAHTLREAA